MILDTTFSLRTAVLCFISDKALNPSKQIFIERETKTVKKCFINNNNSARAKRMREKALPRSAFSWHDNAMFSLTHSDAFINTRACRCFWLAMF